MQAAIHERMKRDDFVCLRAVFMDSFVMEYFAKKYFAIKIGIGLLAFCVSSSADQASPRTQHEFAYKNDG